MEFLELQRVVVVLLMCLLMCTRCCMQDTNPDTALYEVGLDEVYRVTVEVSGVDVERLNSESLHNNDVTCHYMYV